MTFPELGIKRYVMAFMVASAIILFGIVSYSRTGIDEYPKVDFPVVTIMVALQGADPLVMDSTVTSILLSNLNGISGIDNITSSSQRGLSQVVIIFNLDKDIDIALMRFRLLFRRLFPYYQII